MVVIKCRKRRQGIAEIELEYGPRVLEADIEFPEEFPEVEGSPWDLVDWLSYLILSKS